jgi:hypothetical protein
LFLLSLRQTYTLILQSAWHWNLHFPAQLKFSGLHKVFGLYSGWCRLKLFLGTVNSLEYSN